MKYLTRNICARDDLGNKMYWIDKGTFLGRLKNRTAEGISSMILLIEKAGFEITQMKKKNRDIIFNVENILVCDK